MNTNEFIADILIVDDTLENIRFLSQLFSEQQYQVRKAINGKAALTAVRTLPPDLILLDINMPGMTGYEVCQQLKADPRTSSIPVIFLSAGNNLVDKVRAFQVGGVDYITKPFQLEEVLVRVQTQLNIQALHKKLQARNEELQQTVTALQKAQAELVQKEKIASVGRIVAGISHEINNPLSFILGNLNFAVEYSQKLIELFCLYQVEFPNSTPSIKDFAGKNDLSFLISDFTKVMKSIQNGAERIRSVVQALHTFSHFNESGVKQINIHESIESVLVMLRYRFISKDGATKILVLKDYENIPSFFVDINLFNQVIMNLLQNAIDSLEIKMNAEINNSFKPTIWLSTKIGSSGKILISIKDNGVGIAEENAVNIFEPFFTTKQLGQGSGLNLFASNQIVVELHKGSLTYHSLPGEGAEFLIEVPTNILASREKSALGSDTLTPREYSLAFKSMFWEL